MSQQQQQQVPRTPEVAPPESNGTTPATGSSNAARAAALPPSANAPPQEPRGGMSYVAQEGDTPESIAICVYGDASYALDIVLANFDSCEDEEVVFLGGEALDLPVIDVFVQDMCEDTSTRASASPAAVAPAPAPPTQVSNHITDGPYGWDSKYEVTFGAGVCRLNVKVKVVPQPDVSAAEAERIKTETAGAFASLYDGRFTLTDTTTHESFTLRVGITYVDSGEHLLINLYSGNRRNNLSTWSTERPLDTRAHELGHQLGLKDEYVDARVPERATLTDPGVHRDQSIMGYHHDPAAEAKQRHGEVIGGHIGQACGRTFSITTNKK